MSELESKTKEVPSSITSHLPEEKKLEVQRLVDVLNSTLPYEKTELLKAGMASRGWKDISLLKILRECLMIEIEQLQVSKNNDDPNIRLATNQIKRNLKSQVDTVLNILETSTNKKENVYFLIGAVLGSLEKMEQ
tara:strand:+ start:36 stop:440 length:405 start_codon:yes stop_codon:yes gene_type:complete